VGQAVPGESAVDAVLQASDRVWKVLGKTGAAGVFFKRPDACLHCSAKWLARHGG
jgi:hypothetical protein